jgi:hypothetical protein
VLIFYFKERIIDVIEKKKIESGGPKYMKPAAVSFKDQTADNISIKKLSWYV